MSDVYQKKQQLPTEYTEQNYDLLTQKYIFLNYSNDHHFLLWINGESGPNPHRLKVQSPENMVSQWRLPTYIWNIVIPVLRGHLWDKEKVAL